MRIAFISDIHANLISFEAVLADLEREQVDQIVFLGDAATLGPQPREVMARLRALDPLCVTGNHETFLLEPDSVRQYKDDPKLVERIAWCAARLSEADFDYLRSFQPLVRISLDAEATLLCFHALPRSNAERMPVTMPDSELDDILAGYTAAAMVCGHMHMPMLRQHRGMPIVNPGSVGQPFERWPYEGGPLFLPCAQYAIVGWKHGALSVDLRRVPIDLDAVRQAALDSGMPDADFWAELWFEA
jgi:predicted phosphodiesterase